jgi:ABC-type transport system involved in Fe-S cluster assembly fused permease/ATPase subunit
VSHSTELDHTFCCAETVKYFCNEMFEEKRFSSAVVEYQRANYSTQTRCGRVPCAVSCGLPPAIFCVVTCSCCACGVDSLVSLNMSQQFLIAATNVGVLLFVAYDVSQGSESIAQFVTFNAFVVQVAHASLFACVHASCAHNLHRIRARRFSLRCRSWAPSTP